jgi:hypothetical protein
MASITDSEAVYRRQIIHLVKALCEIPDELRRKWRDEIHAKPEAKMTTDEALVLLVLNNLPFSETAVQRIQQRSAKVRRLELVR